MKNKIINKKGLKMLVRNEGVRRLEVEDYLVERISEKIEGLVKGVAEEMIVNGRRTLRKEDVDKVFDSSVEFKDL